MFEGPGGRGLAAGLAAAVITITDSRTVAGFNGATASDTLTRTPGGGTATWMGRGGQTRTYSYAP
jgi:hypothetical protein